MGNIKVGDKVWSTIEDYNPYGSYWYKYRICYVIDEILPDGCLRVGNITIDSKDVTPLTEEESEQYEDGDTRQ